MPLLAPGLEADLTTLFFEPPEGFTACAAAWGDATQTYSAAIIPVSTTVALAIVALKPALEAAFIAGQADGTGVVLASQLETAFEVFALTVGLGMLPVFMATPPPGLVGWLSALQSSLPNTHAEAAMRYSDLIDTWMQTGTATRILTPFETVNWS